MAAGVMALVAAGAASAQVGPEEAEQIRVRQQIATMEIVLQQAIAHGAENVYAKLRSVIPDRPRLGTSRISGFTLLGYGVVFHVDVPMIQLPVLYEVFVRVALAREAQYRNAAMRVQQLRAQLSGMSPGPERNQVMDLISQLEQQLGAGNLRPGEGGRGGFTATSLVPAGITVDQKVVEDPESAYTREVKEALVDAMLVNSQALEIRPDEWLTIVARDGVPPNPQFPGDAVDASTWVMRVKGSVLSAYRARTITKEEARKQVEVREQ
jgi:hypothetical protein